MDDRLVVLIYHVRDVATEIAQFVATTKREDLTKNVMIERGAYEPLHGRGPCDPHTG